MIAAGDHVTSVVIGGLPIDIQSANRDFVRMLEARYAEFVTEPPTMVSVSMSRLCHRPEAAPTRSSKSATPMVIGGQSRRFSRAMGSASMLGCVRQAAYPYAIDSVMRIVHSLVLAQNGGFLVHSASAVRNGNAFLFSGVSGAGKTTISRLAPPDVTLLTDEISYVCRHGDDYQAFGTPFAGEREALGKILQRPSRDCTCWSKGERNHRTGSTRQSPPDDCSVTCSFSPTTPAWSRACFVRSGLRRAGAGLRAELSPEARGVGPDSMSEKVYRPEPRHRRADAGRRDDGHVGHGFARVQPQRDRERDLEGGLRCDSAPRNRDCANRRGFPGRPDIAYEDALELIEELAQAGIMMLADHRLGP